MRAVNESPTKKAAKSEPESLLKSPEETPPPPKN
jgi:hypothetical protein